MYSWTVYLLTIKVFLHLFTIGTNAYDMISAIRSPPVRGIPIRPLDYTTIRRLAHKSAPINPDSESIFLPVIAEKYKPYQVMERISAPTTPKTGIERKFNRNKDMHNRDNFNFLNFDAYLVKPTEFSYNNVLATLKPESERILRLMNYTDRQYNDEPTLSPSVNYHKLRKTSTKKSKKNHHLAHMKDPNDFELYKAYENQKKQVIAMKKLKKHLAQQQHPRNANRYNANTKLPIGIEFFEQRHKSRIPYPPITYSPLYLNNLHRKQNYEDVEASNIHINTQRMEVVPIEDEMTMTMTTTTASPTIILPTETNELQHKTDSPSEDTHTPEEAKAYHNLVSAPEMFKFTIDDAVIRPPKSLRSHFRSATYPTPTLPTPSSTPFTPLTNEYYVQQDSSRNSHVDVENNAQNIRAPYRPHIPHYYNHYNSNNNNNNNNNNQLSYNSNYENRVNHEASDYATPNIGYRRLERMRYNRIPLEAQSSSRRQFQKYPTNQIVMTTQMAVTTTDQLNNNSGKDIVVSTIPTNTEFVNQKQFVEKPRQKKRRIPLHVKPTASQNDETNKNARKPHQKDNFFNNLEFSSSYSKQRTQGYNSGEDQSTTPISPIKLKNAHRSSNNESSQISTAATTYRRARITTNAVKPKSESIKYFQ